MKTKHLIILVTILSVLLGLLLVKNIAFKPDIKVNEYTHLGISIKEFSVYAIEAKKVDDKTPFKLKKKDDIWRIASEQNVRADKEKIKNFIEQLSELEGELRSTSKRIFSDYDIADDKAFSITIYGEKNKILKKLFIGTKRPKYGSVFLRMDNSPKVYMVNKDIFSLLEIYGDPAKGVINTDKWVDLFFIDIVYDDIDSFKITKSIEEQDIVTVELTKQTNENNDTVEWTAPQQQQLFDIDTNKVKRFMQDINTIKAVKTLDPEAKDYGFDEPYLRFSYNVNQEPKEIIVGAQEKKDSEDRYIKDAEGYVYLVRKNNAGRLYADLNAFFTANPFGIDKENLLSINIKSDKDVVNLDKELIGKNKAYLNKLKKFTAKNMLFDKKYTKDIRIPAKYSLTIEKQDGQKIELVAKQYKDDVFAAQIIGKDLVFELDKKVFENMFSGLDKIDCKKEMKEENKE